LNSISFEQLTTPVDRENPSNQPWDRKELEQSNPKLVFLHFLSSIAKSKECAETRDQNIEKKAYNCNTFGNIWDFEDQ
jgi:hypothetical protein